MTPVQPSVVADQRHVKLSAVPSSGTVNSMIRITGIGDRDRPEWLIRISGIRTGPFSLDAVRAVAAEKMEASEIVDCVADLVGKSLVIRTADQAGAGFRLLETTRV
jgi:hypothetical protein